MTTVRMEEMPWPAIRAAIDGGHKTVIVAVGATEQHGPHLPTMTDARIGDAVAELVARKLGHALVARTIAVGVSEHELAFGGTVSLKPGTLGLVLRDYVASLARCGFTWIVFVPTHGGNFPVVREAVLDARAAHPGLRVTGCTDMPGSVRALRLLSVERGVSPSAFGVHAGEMETSMMMALEPGLVAEERFAAGYVGPLGPAEVQGIRERGLPDLTPSGVLGDPRGASASRGRDYLECFAHCLVAQLRDTATT